MPRLIRHIDQIAREKNRDVVFASFEQPPKDDKEEREVSFEYPAPNHFNHDWHTDFNRLHLISWLEERGIAHEDAGEYASENGWRAYNGNLYIDIPFDEADPQYRTVIEYLENPDGTPRNPLLKLWVLSHKEALKNAHHDEPGFWERWAETF